MLPPAERAAVRLPAYVELMVADLASLDAVRRLAAEFCQKNKQLHVLLNNAGAYNAQPSLTEDGFEMTSA